MKKRTVLILLLAAALVVGVLWATSYPKGLYVGLFDTRDRVLYMSEARCGDLHFRRDGGIESLYIARGWPSMSWRTERWEVFAQSGGFSVCFVDMGAQAKLLYATRIPCSFLVILLCAYPCFELLFAGPRRRRHRARHGLCLRCGYDLRGNVSGVCPECGHRA